jgi:glycerol-3-phosphate dehydrogenase (NAD(P)+)
MTRVAVLGGGSWGTALAQAMRQGDHEVVLWARDRGLIDAINAGHENPRYLPGVPLDPGIRATSELAEAARS